MRVLTEPLNSKPNETDVHRQTVDKPLNLEAARAWWAHTALHAGNVPGRWSCQTWTFALSVYLSDIVVFHDT